MVAVVVGVLDRHGWDARTDNIVIVDDEARRLLWVPRDLYSPMLDNRINTAFARGGHSSLISALQDVGFAVDHSLCAQRAAVEQAVGDLTVTVPVERAMEFWYPLRPTDDIEAGRKLIRFSPPSEVLSGERIHQWVGARTSPTQQTNDFHRMDRQATLVRQLLRSGFDFSRVVSDPTLVSLSTPDAMAPVRAVAENWALELFTAVAPVTIRGMAALRVDGSRPWDPFAENPSRRHHHRPRRAVETIAHRLRRRR